MYHTRELPDIYDEWVAGAFGEATGLFRRLFFLITLYEKNYSYSRFFALFRSW